MATTAMYDDDPTSMMMTTHDRDTSTGDAHNDSKAELAHDHEHSPSSPLDHDSFRIVMDRTLASELARGSAACAAWSPTMDLLAIVTCDDRLSVHRLNWQLIFSVAIDASAGAFGSGEDDEEGGGYTRGVVSSVTSICWRWDGRVIALGQRDGTISLYSGHNGDKLQSSQIHHAAVTSLHWIVEAEHIPRDDTTGRGSVDTIDHGHSTSIHHDGDRAGKFFAALPPVLKAPNGPPLGIPTPMPPSDDTPIIEPAPSPIFDAPTTTRLSVLISADTNGYIHMDAYGTLPIAHFRIPSPLPSLPIAVDQIVPADNTGDDAAPTTIRRSGAIRRSILDVHAAADLHSLTIAYTDGTLVSSSPSLLGSSSSTGAVASSSVTALVGDTRLAVYDTHILRARRHELQLVTAHTQHIQHLCGYIEGVLQAATKRWEDAYRSNMANKFNGVRQNIEESETEPDDAPADYWHVRAEEDLLAFLLTGVPSAPLHTFLSELDERRLITNATFVELTFTLLSYMILNQLSPAVEQLTYRMTELRALARWKERYGILGLDVDALTALVDQCSLLVMKVEELRRTMIAVRGASAAFFQWMIRTVHNLSADDAKMSGVADVEKIADFINNDLHHDRLGQSFKPVPMTTAILPLPVMSPGVTLPSHLADAWSRDSSRSLRNVFAMIRAQWQRLLQRPVTTISQLWEPTESTSSSSPINRTIPMMNLFSFVTKAAPFRVVAAASMIGGDHLTNDEDTHIVASYQSRVALTSFIDAIPIPVSFPITPVVQPEPLEHHHVAFVLPIAPTTPQVSSLMFMRFTSPVSSASMPSPDDNKSSDHHADGSGGDRMVSLSHVSFAPLCDDEATARIVDVRFYKSHLCAVLVQYTATTAMATDAKVAASSQTIATPLRSKNSIGSSPSLLSSTTSSPLSSGVTSPMFHTPTGTIATSKTATPLSSSRTTNGSTIPQHSMDELTRALQATSAPSSSSGNSVRVMRSRLWLIPYDDEHVTCATIGMNQLSNVTTVTSLMDQLPAVPVHTIINARQRSLPHIIACGMSVSESSSAISVRIASSCVWSSAMSSVSAGAQRRVIIIDMNDMATTTNNNTNHGNDDTPITE